MYWFVNLLNYIIDVIHLPLSKESILQEFPKCIRQCRKTRNFPLQSKASAMSRVGTYIKLHILIYISSGIRVQFVLLLIAWHPTLHTIATYEIVGMLGFIGVGC